MKKIGSFLYVDLVMPAVCLYGFGLTKFRLEAYTKETFDPIPSWAGQIIIYMALGVLLAVLAQLCSREAGRMSTIIMLTVGIVIALLAYPVSRALDFWLAFYYSLPFGLLYLGACIYLDIYNLYCRWRRPR